MSEQKHSRWTEREFLTTMLVNLIFALAVFGIFQQADLPELQSKAGEIAEAVEGITAFVVLVVNNLAFLWSRTRFKTKPPTS